MIDTHAHFNSKDLKNLKRQIQIIESLTYLDKIINVGLDYQTSKEAAAISLKYPNFYATLGIHPLHSGTISSLKKLYETLDCSKVVAIGETGLDSSTKEDITIQENKFIETINFANEINLPIIIHANNTNKQALEIIKENLPQAGFVFHCFQPNLEIMEEIIGIGGYISVATPITRPTAKKSLEVIKNIPLENLLIELDYPYMSDNPEIDGKNVFNKIKELRHLKYNDLEDILDSNAKRLFKKL